MLALPLLLVAYPAWRIAARMLDYSAASTVEAKLTAIDIRTVEIGQDQASLFEARKHYDVVFDFEDDKEKQYAAMAEMSWPAPGLKRRLEDEYPAGDTYTLYLLPDQSVAMDAMVTRDSTYRLTGLMSLVFVASALFFMLWKRLARRWPSAMPRFPAATEKSIMLGQLIALVVAGLLAVAISFNPLAINTWLYAGGYWGLVAFISLSLRLLVFADIAAAPAADHGKKKS